MNEHDTCPDINLFSLEKDISEIAPLFDAISENRKLGSPSVAILNRIHAEADRHLIKRKFQHKIRRVLRIAAAVAVLILVMDGGMLINERQQNNRRQELLNQLCIVSSDSENDTSVIKETTDSSTAALAEMLMEMQGFDEESYFAVN